MSRAALTVSTCPSSGPVLLQALLTELPCLRRGGVEVGLVVIGDVGGEEGVDLRSPARSHGASTADAARVEADDVVRGQHVGPEDAVDRVGAGSRCPRRPARRG